MTPAQRDNLNASHYTPYGPTYEQWRRRRSIHAILTWIALVMVAVDIPIMAAAQWGPPAGICFGVATAAWLWMLICETAHAHHNTRKGNHNGTYTDTSD